MPTRLFFSQTSWVGFSRALVRARFAAPRPPSRSRERAPARVSRPFPFVSSNARDGRPAREVQEKGSREKKAERPFRVSRAFRLSRSHRAARASFARVMLPQAFVAAGIVLWKLRERSRNANECFDFDELELEEAKRASIRTCCSSGSLDCLDADAANECKFCDESSICRFCFAGPERGELISPCACVGSQVRARARPRGTPVARYFSHPRFALVNKKSHTVCPYEFISTTPRRHVPTRPTQRRRGG